MKKFFSFFFWKRKKKIINQSNDDDDKEWMNESVDIIFIRYLVVVVFNQQKIWCSYWWWWWKWNWTTTKKGHELESFTCMCVFGDLFFVWYDNDGNDHDHDQRWYWYHFWFFWIFHLKKWMLLGLINRILFQIFYFLSFCGYSLFTGYEFCG